MGTVKIDDELHEIIKNSLKDIKFRIDNKDVKGFVDKAVYKLLLEKKLLKEGKNEN